MYTVTELAKACGVVEATVRQWIKKDYVTYAVIKGRYYIANAEAERMIHLRKNPLEGLPNVKHPGEEEKEGVTSSYIRMLLRDPEYREKHFPGARKIGRKWYLPEEVLPKISEIKRQK
jgi:hypothetical protein